MKFWIQLLLLIIIDLIIIWFWVGQIDPDPSVSIALVLLLPFVIAINLILSVILYFTKRKYALVFLINTIPSAFLMNYLYIAAINQHQDLRYESWSFKIGDSTYRITHSKLDSSFDMSYNINQSFTVSFLQGKFTNTQNHYLLITDSTNYAIENNYLLGFRRDSFKLTKIND